MPRAALSDHEIEAFRESLCRVATRRFAEAGYAGVTLRGLAAELGVSPMTPYRYFRDKDEIFAAVRAAGFRRFGDALEQAGAAERKPGPRLLALGRVYVDFARREPDAYRIMFEMKSPEDAAHPELASAALRAFGFLVEGVRAAVESGLLQGDPLTVALVFWAGMHGVVSLDLSHGFAGEATLDTLAEPMLGTLFRGAARAPDALEKLQ